MKDILRAIFGSSPRTTIIGYALAALVTAQPIIMDDNFKWDEKTIYKLIFALGIALMGRAMKDSNGVTSQQGKAMAEEVLSEVPKDK